MSCDASRYFQKIFFFFRLKKSEWTYLRFEKLTTSEKRPTFDSFFLGKCFSDKQEKSRAHIPTFPLLRSKDKNESIFDWKKWASSKDERLNAGRTLIQLPEGIFVCLWVFLMGLRNLKIFWVKWKLFCNFERKRNPSGMKSWKKTLNSKGLVKGKINRKNRV